MQDPSQIANLVHRFRASSITGTANGAAVPSVAFETGGLVYTASGAAQPTFLTSGAGGRAALHFDGAANYLTWSSGGATIPQPFTIIVVATLGSVGPDQQIVYFSGAEIFLNILGTTGYQAYYNATLSGGTPRLGTQSIMASSISGGNGEVKVSGVSVAQGSAGNASIAFDANGRIAQHPSANRPFSGDIYEILIYSRNLNDSAAGGDRAVLGAYLQNTYKYAMAEYSLPLSWVRA